MTFPSSNRQRETYLSVGRDICLSILSGVLLILSFPPFGHGWLCWIALIPLVLSLNNKGLGTAFLLSYLTGVVMFTGVFVYAWSVKGFTAVDYLLIMGLYLPHYFSLWGLMVSWLRRRTGLSVFFLGPALWVAQEYLRAHAGFLSFPGGLLGHTQYLHPLVLQMSSIGGVYVISFVLMSVNVACADWIRYWLCRNSSQPQACSPSMFLSSILVTVELSVILLYGWLAIRQHEPIRTLRVSIIQAGVSQDLKWDASYRKMILDRYARMTEHAVAEGPELIVWPEAAVPGDPLHDPGIRAFMETLVRKHQIPLLAGSSEYAKFSNEALAGKHYNSVFLVTNQGVVEEPYRKMVLFPFGEFDPLHGFLPWPEALVKSIGRDEPGHDYSLFQIHSIPIATPICWEIVFPDHIRQFVKRGAQIIVSATNEAWFPGIAAPEQMLAISVFRAVEHHISVVRVSNVAFSAYLDPIGQIHPIQVGIEDRDSLEGFFVNDVAVSPRRTFYTECGDIFTLVIVLILGIQLARSWSPSGCAINSAHAFRHRPLDLNA
jgi:apolipoprotein N-acyltransferase